MMPPSVQSTLRLRGDDGQPGESPGPYFSYRSRGASADGEVTVTFAARRGSIGPDGAAGALRRVSGRVARGARRAAAPVQLPVTSSSSQGNVEELDPSRTRPVTPAKGAESRASATRPVSAVRSLHASWFLRATAAHGPDRT